MIQITAVRLGGHEHITDLLWRSEATSAGLSSRQALVDWLTASSSNQAVVLQGSRVIHVEIVRAVGEVPTSARVQGSYGPIPCSSSLGSDSDLEA